MELPPDLEEDFCRVENEVSQTTKKGLPLKISESPHNSPVDQRQPTISCFYIFITYYRKNVNNIKKF